MRLLARTAITVGFSVALALFMQCGVMGELAMESDAPSDKPTSDPLAAAKTKAIDELIAKHGESQRERIRRGVQQVASLWRPPDGDADTFTAWLLDHFISDSAILDDTFHRLQFGFEQIDGHLNEIGRELRRQSELDLGPILPIDRVFAAFDPYAHLSEDMFGNKAAFIVLLNFPLTSLEDRLEQGPKWTRRQWAEARLAQRFARRVPADVNQQITKASADGDAYIAQYNIWMHHLVDDQGKRLFPSGLRLISHWNLRDELKANYANRENGLAKQRMIAQVMDRIVTQTIPRVVIDNPHVDWNPYTNTVTAAPAGSIEPSAPARSEAAAISEQSAHTREPDTRYQHLLNTFRAARRVDPYSPKTPTHIARRFQDDRELPETRVRQMFEQLMTSPLVPRVARLIEQRLGRKLEPFDIWYNGFLPRSNHAESELDAVVAKKYPNAEAFQRDMPRLLRGLGFTPERSDYLASMIEVDASRGAGHAMPALRRGDKPRLRTRVEKSGMNYKGYNIAVHELGHNVEQVFSLYDVDHTLLAGVPNNAFTEALAFVFQKRDLELLGLTKSDAENDRLRVLNEFWMTFEICGPALVDIAVWHWMYEHPEATAAELRDATVAIAKEIWNKFYAPVFGKTDVPLLAIYSHMVSLMMYLPDYPLGHFIAFQIEEQISRSGRPLGEEFERMAKFGRVSPDLWMKHATGEPVSTEALLRAAERALTSQ